MNLPLSWLKQFVNVKATAKEIAERLTLSGSEVEKITRHDAGLSKVVVGQIKEIKPHPNADKLRLAYVDIGKGKSLEIVCGGNNIEAGQKVPVVLLGGSVPGLKIEPREIRGVKSQGMLCSQRELGIGDDHAGIFILPPTVKVGTDVVELLELDEPVLELEITPNRADCFSVRGLAREVAALFSRKLAVGSWQLAESKKKASEVISVEVKDNKLCPKYTARVIENVAVKPSPLWLQNKLRQVGIKPINNVVDVTNYVMMELGQPLHAFEADKRGEQRGLTRIVVRRARKGEKILALDDNTYTLNDSMLVITDGDKPIAIAGVMGGEETGVKENTETVILEAAAFDPVSVRKTSRALGLRSESSMRFEKGVDLASIETASNLAAKMIAELSGGTVLKGVVFVGAGFKPAQTVKISTTEIARLLGIDIPVAKIKSILQSLGFGVRPHPSPPLSKGRELSVQIPSWRADVTQAADIIEEIGRMIDYNTLPKTLPCGEAQSPEKDLSYRMRRKLRQFLIASGYSEILTYSFYDEKLLALSGVKESSHIVVANPVSIENKYLRANLLPWMLSKLSGNSSLLSRDQFCLFEIGKVFVKPNAEKWQLAAGLIDVAGSDEVLFRRLRGISEVFFGSSETGQIIIYPKGQVPNMRFRSSVGVLLVDLDEAAKNLPDERRVFRSLPYYPQIERDLAMVVPEAVQYKQIEEVIKGFDPLLKQAELFDVYHGLGEGQSLAFRLTFGSTDRTLEAGEVEEILERLKLALQKNFKIAFR